MKNLQYVLVCGGPALQCVTPHSSIEQWRGSCEQRDGKWFVYTYNPAAVIREPKLEPILRLDIHKFFAVVEGRFKPYTIVPIINPSPNEAIAHVTRSLDESRGKDVKPVAFDIETIAGETACIGLTNDDHAGMCINFRTESDNRWTVEEEITLWLDIANLVSHPNVRLVMQNGMFDASYLWFVERVKVSAFYFDTMLAHHTLYPSLPHGLGFLTTQYTTHPYYKDDGKLWKDGGSIEAEWEYNVTDVCVTLAC